MKLTLTPNELPFAVGDTVWVDQSFGARHEFPFFQGIVTQIILDGNLSNTPIIRSPKEVHKLVVPNAVYSLKPIGEHIGLPRVNVNV